MRRRRNPGQLLLPALALAILVSLWGMVYRLEPHQDEPIIEAVLTGGEDSSGQPSLAPGETAMEELRFINRGRVGFELRIKLCSAEINSKPVLQPGHITMEGFAPSMVPEAEPNENEYWTARGEYLYYRNARTGDLLMPGRETPAAYSAVQMNARLEPEELETLALMGSAHCLYAVAEVRGEGAGEWQELQKGPAGSANLY